MRWSATALLLGACSFTPGGMASGNGDGGPSSDAGACAVVEVDSFDGHTCARTGNGDVWCFGRNERGSLGMPAADDCGTVPCNKRPVRLPVAGAVQIALGSKFVCVRTPTQVFCTGANDAGQFGNAGSDEPLLREMPLRAGADALVAGESHTCALHRSTVRCSGANGAGETGNGTVAPQLTPAAVLNLSPATGVGAGFRHACGITGFGVECWGANTNGQVTGNPGSDGLQAARIDIGQETPIAVAGGIAHTCALLASGAVKCWGINANGQLGTGDNQGKSGPQVVRIDSAAELAVGFQHACVRKHDGSVWCWGEKFGTEPTRIELPGAAVAIGAGNAVSCAALQDGRLLCWGDNAYGQLGSGTTGGSTGTTAVSVAICGS